MGGGSAPPGAPLIAKQGNQTIGGGTGAFLGVRGYQGVVASAQSVVPTASATEDPANRRLRSGGRNHHVLYLIPMFYPEIVSDADGPLVVHAINYSPVTATNPASGGEILIMI